jgi:hypothetical protein
MSSTLPKFNVEFQSNIRFFHEEPAPRYALLALTAFEAAGGEVDYSSM